jgi:putative oxidoreductase
MKTTNDRLLQLIGIIIGAVFIYAGALKVADPVGFAHDIDNYKTLPWTVSVAVAFYLPWLEIFSGLALITGRIYRGALTILTGLIAAFILVSIAAKARGLDITCGCFGHVSKGWSFASHMLVDFSILAALLLIWMLYRRRDVAPS